MGLYLFEAAYTSQSWKTQLEARQDIRQRIEAMTSDLGGRLIDLYYSFGDYDVVTIFEFPSPEAAAAFSLAVSAGGSVKAAKTTPLLTVEQGIEAMSLGAEAGKDYRPPVS